MFLKGLLGWLLSLVVAFNAGAGIGKPEPDPELEQKVSDHIDVIVDEAAGIVDDISESAKARREEFKNSDAYKEAEEFATDVEEIINNTIDDINEHFGTDETELSEEAAEAADAKDAEKEETAETEALTEAETEKADKSA